MPMMIGSVNPSWKPLVNRLPSPPAPTSAPTLTRLMFATVATRSPANSTGTAIGSSTPSSCRSGR